MSPCNFSFEYLFLFERKEYHLPSLSSKPVIKSSSEKSSLPMILTFFILALSPSSMMIFSSMVFLGLSTVSISTFAPYLPWEAYCLTSSLFIPFRVERLYTWPSAMPAPSSPVNKSSDFNALLPSSSIAEMDGLSKTLIIKAFPSLPI